jgi:hypothetical protein
LEEYHRSLGDFATIEATGKTQCEAAHTHVDFRANESPGVLAGASKEECRMSIWGSRCPGRSDILFHGCTNHARRGPRRGGGAIRSRWHIRCAASIIVIAVAHAKTATNRTSPCANARPQPKAASAGSATSSRTLRSSFILGVRAMRINESRGRMKQKEMAMMGKPHHDLRPEGRWSRRRNSAPTSKFLRFQRRESGRQ